MIEARESETGLQRPQQREMVVWLVAHLAIMRIVRFDEHHHLVGSIGVVVLVPNDDDRIAPGSPCGRGFDPVHQLGDLGVTLRQEKRALGCC
jgi:hypothetical protein